MQCPDNDMTWLIGEFVYVLPYLIVEPDVVNDSLHKFVGVLLLVLDKMEVAYHLEHGIGEIKPGKKSIFVIVDILVHPWIKRSNHEVTLTIRPICHVSVEKMIYVNISCPHYGLVANLAQLAHNGTNIVPAAQ